MQNKMEIIRPYFLYFSSIFSLEMIGESVNERILNMCPYDTKKSKIDSRFEIYDITSEINYFGELQWE